MKPGFHSVFIRLRKILRAHAPMLSVKEDSALCYSLEAGVGPAAVRAWGGRMKRRTIPVAWVQIGKTCVSYHLMGICADAALRDGMSEGLRTRMQGRTCFNFTSIDEALFKEPEPLTAKAVAGFKKAGFVS